MLSEPFRHEIKCIKEVAEFLLAPQNRSSGLWVESLEDTWRSEHVYSLWATADIMRSLLAVVDLKEPELDDLKKEFLEAGQEFTKRIQSLLDEIEKYRHRQKKRDIAFLVERPKGDDKNTIPYWLDTLAEIARETQGYYGLPRSVIVAGTAEDKRQPRGTSNLIASCLIQRVLGVLRVKEGIPVEINAWVKEFAIYLARPEYSMLRQAVSEIQPKAATIQDARELWSNLRDAYERRRNQWCKPEGLKSFPPPGLSEIDTLSTWIKDLPSGAMWIDDNGQAGWMSVPFQTGSGIDPIATLVALEALAGSEELLTKSHEKEYLFDAFNAGLTWFERFVQCDLPKAGWQTALEDDPHLSDRWSLGLLSRFVVWLSWIIEQIGSENSPGWNDFKARLSTLKEIIYTSLLVRVFRIIVEERSVPFESVPTALVAGNEISHWPGVDLGLVGFALLRGRAKYNWHNCCGRYTELGQFATRIFETCCDGDSDLPIELPLFSSVITMVKRQIIGSHNEKSIGERLRTRCGIGKDKEIVLRGAFLSSTGMTPGVEMSPTVYLWATAHALLALTEWRKGVTSDAKKARIIKLEDDLGNAKKSLIPHQIYDGTRMATGLWVGTICAVIYGLLAKFSMPKGSDEFNWHSLLVSISLLIPSVLWFLWLFSVLSKRVEGFLDWANLGPYRAYVSRALKIPPAVVLLTVTLWSLKSLATTFPALRQEWFSWLVLSSPLIYVIGEYGNYIFSKHAPRPDSIEDFVFPVRVTVKLLFGWSWRPRDVSLEDLEDLLKQLRKDVKGFVNLSDNE